MSHNKLADWATRTSLAVAVAQTIHRMQKGGHVNVTPRRFGTVAHVRYSVQKEETEQRNILRRATTGRSTDKAHCYIWHAIHPQDFLSGHSLAGCFLAGSWVDRQTSC